MAGALDCAPGAFFEGLDGAGREPAPEAASRAADWRALLSEMLAAPGGRELAAAWLAVPPGPVRSRLTALVVAVGDGAVESP